MKISVNWLKDFIPDFSPDIAELVDRLTFLGFEVEEVFEQLPPDRLVVVGRIEEVRPHPNADRLRICLVDTGAGELQQIVCGAPNVEPGMLVPVAGIGAVLKTVSGETFTIRPAKIRGERSSGMICAADELGLSDDHAGVMVLEEGCRIGEPLAAFLSTDVVLEVAVTPNRPDALSHLGIARELADVAAIRLPDVTSLGFRKGGNLVEVRDSAACPYYSAVVIRGITVAPSPHWLASRLEQIGLRPKNNIVDITNYILHSFGQPLHAFDFGRLGEGRIVVRTDCNTEVTALDGENYHLSPGMTAICDGEGQVGAVGGVMGGLCSAVSDSTTDILLESAYFNPASIRRTSKELGLSSDSSYRFERGIDPCNVRRAAEYAVALILECAGGAVVAAEECGSMPETPKIVTIRPKRVNEILGSSLEADKMVELLSRIGFVPLSQEQSSPARVPHEMPSHEPLSIAFSVPSFRVDVEAEIDLVEEVARLHGYNNLEPSGSMVSSYPVSRRVPEYFPDYLRTIMIGLNFHEVLTNPLVNKAEASRFPLKPVEALNPISEELAVLRPNLVPSLLKVVAHNIRHGNRDLRLFEVAHGFSLLEEGERIGTHGSPLDAYRERELLTFVITGKRYPRLWNQQNDDADFYDIRGVAEMLLAKLNLLDKSALNMYNSTTVGIEIELAENGKPRILKAGTVQQIGSDMLDAFEVDQDVFLAEIDVPILETCFNPGIVYEPPSKFPVVERDLSFVLAGDIPVQRLVDCARKSDTLVRSVCVFDVFERKEATGDGSRSVAVSLQIADAAGTMNEERINTIITKVSDNARRELGAVIRQV